MVNSHAPSKPTLVHIDSQSIPTSILSILSSYLTNTCYMYSTQCTNKYMLYILWWLVLDHQQPPRPFHHHLPISLFRSEFQPRPAHRQGLQHRGLGDMSSLSAPRASLPEDERVHHILYAILCMYIYIYVYIYYPIWYILISKHINPPKILGPEQQRATW